MKKVLISMVAAGAMISSASAIEVYKEGDNTVNIFGTIRAVAGYGHVFRSTAIKSEIAPFYGRSIIGSDIIFGLQSNSRIGIDFKYNGFFGAALIGANEATLYGVSASGTPGFRQLYAGYDFGNAGKLLIGKVELPTSMGFSSDIFDSDNGQKGFGGTSTSTRRFQVQYSLPLGLTIAISENDFNVNNNYSKMSNKSIPRLSMSYEYNTKELVAKVAATYAYGNQYDTTTAHVDPKNAFLITAGVKPTFGNMYVSTMLTYGLNSNLIGESSIGLPWITKGINNISLTTSSINNLLVDTNAPTNDINFYSALAEFGYSINDSLKAIVGAGYQYASVFQGAGQGYIKVHSYSAFFQLPYAVSKNFSIIPQVGYLGATNKQSEGKGTPNAYVAYTSLGGIYAIAQARFTF